jgi:aminoglycoside phosphotransferase (APT) family kinase protein
MSSLPWEPDRPLTREAATSLIEACFPAIESAALQHLGSGWEFDAFLTTDGWVFRFPRRKESAGLFASEARVHHLVAQVLPSHVRVPQVELLAAPTLHFPYPFAGHRFIPGIAADTADDHLMPTIARQIAALLSALHSTPEPHARAAGIREMDVNEVGRQEWLAHGFAVASELQGLDSAVDHALTWLSQTPSTTPFDGPPQLIHHDLGPDHLLVDSADGSLLGVLDWTDAILGDAARDFVFLVTWQGWGFAEEVLGSYPRVVDHEFRTRLRSMAQLLSVMWLATAHEQGCDLARHLQAVRNAFAPDNAS